MGRKFIAGAICPSCDQQDKLFTYSEGSRSIRECVRCGFSDFIENEPAPTEVATRVNQPLAATPQSEPVQAEVVRFIDGEKSVQKPNTTEK